MGQVLILLGLILTGLSLVDCRFVRANVFVLNSTNYTNPIGDLTAWDGDPNARTGFGTFLYQDESGRCMVESWGEDFNENENDGGFNSTDFEEVEEHIEDYINWLGDDWERIRRSLGTALGSSLILSVWIIVMMCVAHIRALRILVAAIPFLLIMPLQLSSLTILSSDFCKERNCVLDRAGIGAICAGFMYFAAGITLMFTKSYARERQADGSEQRPESQRQRSAGTELAAIEMVDIVEDASYVIEDDRARANTEQVEEVVIGDGLAEATEIKPDMIFLHTDGENINDHGPSAVVHQTSPPVAAAASAASVPAEAVIPTVTEVQVLDEFSKTKVAP